MKSYVAKKTHERWLWHAIDHETGTIIAYVLGTRQDRMFLKLKRFLKNITDARFGDWTVYK